MHDIGHTVVMVSTLQADEIPLQRHPHTPAGCPERRQLTIGEIDVEQKLPAPTPASTPDAPRASPRSGPLLCKGKLPVFSDFRILSQPTWC